MARSRAALAIACLFALVGCTMPALGTPTPTASASMATATEAASPASPSASVAASATPGSDAVPSFAGGELIGTTVPGLRVRQGPGTDHRVIADLLPGDAELAVVMGPIFVDGLGWYLVTDADDGPPDFEEGWVAAGFEPEPNVRSTGTMLDDSPVVAALAQTGDAEFGPIAIADERHIIRWVAVDPEGVRCTFAVTLAAGSEQPIPAIRSTVGADLVPGTLPSSYFVAEATLRGQVFLAVESDCAWALAVMEERVPEPSPTP